ncbi:hypothetical protein [Novosphingobium naphthalenivorans]|uniref:hypothetical protein n=1 Tax=Novosphingobium naphthalenivorans TaxID=273168 RepID=UPI000B25E64B|nr:hypothetical protein [Novosphingobium naphthalenivorans]
MSSKLILKIGNFGGNVEFIYPDGGLDDLSKYGLQTVFKVAGAGVAGIVTNVSEMVSKRILGGLPFPGTLYVYEDRLEFRPAFRLIGFIYKGIEEIIVPSSLIKLAEQKNKGLIVNYVEIFLHEGGSVKIASMLHSKKIAQAINSMNTSTR